jgi:hypothetical protein
MFVFISPPAPGMRGAGGAGSLRIVSLACFYEVACQGEVRRGVGREKAARLRG